jgi:hypothetical protein
VSCWACSTAIALETSHLKIYQHNLFAAASVLQVSHQPVQRVTSEHAAGLFFTPSVPPPLRARRGLHACEIESRRRFAPGCGETRSLSRGKT